jgi:hypothetical protein
LSTIDPAILRLAYEKTTAYADKIMRRNEGGPEHWQNQLGVLYTIGLLTDHIWSQENKNRRFPNFRQVERIPNEGFLELRDLMAENDSVRFAIELLAGENHELWEALQKLKEVEKEEDLLSVYGEVGDLAHLLFQLGTVTRNEQRKRKAKSKIIDLYQDSRMFGLRESQAKIPGHDCIVQAIALTQAFGQKIKTVLEKKNNGAALNDQELLNDADLLSLVDDLREIALLLRIDLVVALGVKNLRNSTKYPFPFFELPSEIKKLQGEERKQAIEELYSHRSKASKARWKAMEADGMDDDVFIQSAQMMIRYLARGGVPTPLRGFRYFHQNNRPATVEGLPDFLLEAEQDQPQEKQKPLDPPPKIINFKHSSLVVAAQK